jgi:hypothetical protein
MSDRSTPVVNPRPSDSRQPLIALVIVIALAYAWGAGLTLLQVL